MKTCPQCNASVSDEYRFCLNCGTVLETSAHRNEEPLPTLVYQRPLAEPSHESTAPSNIAPLTASEVPPTKASEVPPTKASEVPPTTASNVPPTKASDVSAKKASSISPLTANDTRPTMPSSMVPTSKGSRGRLLPWLLVAACLVTIVVLVTIIAVQKRSSATETVATVQSPEPTATPIASDAASSPNSDQPTPASSVSPTEKKETPTPTATPTATATVTTGDNNQAVPTATPTQAVVIITPTPTPTPTPQPAVDSNRVYSIRDVSEKARIVSQPQPGYTEDARKNQIQGTVVLRVVLKSDGTIGNISVVSGLADGLTERAILAARSIQFTPAQKDGVPVSVSLQVQYVFNLY